MSRRVTLQADVLRVYSQLNASNITSGSISTSLLQADVVKTTTLQASIANLPSVTTTYLTTQQASVSGNLFANNFSTNSINFVPIGHFCRLHVEYRMNIDLDSKKIYLYP